jgi:polar amino acid transport system substrate-binding protein
MRRIAAATVFVAVAAAAFAAWGLAAPAAPDAARPAAPAVKKPKLPALPAAVKNRKRWIVGVKCDAPPFGYIDVRGRNAGFDVEIARWFSRYAFGRDNRVSFECAPTAIRESSPINQLSDINGKRIATTSGSIYDRWMRRCFSGAQLTVTDSIANAILAFNQGRADAVMWDDTVLVGVAAADRNSKLTNDTFLALPYGIGIKQGNVAMKRWVDSRLELMRKKDAFMPILRNNVPARFVTGFSRNILRPNNTFGYAAPGTPSADTVCP